MALVLEEMVWGMCAACALLAIFSIRNSARGRVSGGGKRSRKVWILAIGKHRGGFIGAITLEDDDNKTVNGP